MRQRKPVSGMLGSGYVVKFALGRVSHSAMQALSLAYGEEGNTPQIPHSTAQKLAQLLPHTPIPKGPAAGQCAIGSPAAASASAMWQSSEGRKLQKCLQAVSFPYCTNSLFGPLQFAAIDEQYPSQRGFEVSVLVVDEVVVPPPVPAVFVVAAPPPPVSVPDVVVEDDEVESEVGAPPVPPMLEVVGEAEQPMKRIEVMRYFCMPGSSPG